MSYEELEATLRSYARLSQYTANRLNRLRKDIERKFRYRAFWNPHTGTYFFVKATSRRHKYAQRAIRSRQIKRGDLRGTSTPQD